MKGKITKIHRSEKNKIFGRINFLTHHKISTLLAGIGLLFSTSVFAVSNQEKIAEVKSGKRTEARVEWWGFDTKDSTEALQQAINSGAAKVIVSKMDSPWLTRPLLLRDNIEFIIEEGAVVKAKSGEYKHLNDCLLTAIGCKNIIIGGGGSLIMNKKDYQNPEAYEPSEWRHTINLLSCENITIENLEIIGSGGDGIYIGSRPALKAWRGARFHGAQYAKLPNYCKNIIIKNCFIDDNHRQGISVISVEDLLISNTIVSNTDGTAPMAGIDFEPNRSDQRLVNCVLENCTMQDNKIYGLVIYSTLSDKTEPISITLKNCLIKGGKGRGIVISMSPKTKSPAKGLIKFIDCRIINTGDTGIELRSFYSNGSKIIFENCKLENTALEQPGRSPITISLAPTSIANTGNAEFENCTVVDKMKRQLMQFNNLAGKPVVEKVTGTVIYGGQKIDMAEYIKEHKMDVSNVLAMAPLDQKVLFPQGGYVLQNRRKAQPRLIFRREVRFLLAAEKDATVKFNLKYNRISPRIRQTVMPVALATPSGKNIKLESAILDKANSYSFVAPEKGVYIVSCNPGGQRLQITDCNVPFSIAMPENESLALFRAHGRIYFGIPADIEEFSVEIAGEDSETISAQIYIENTLVDSADHISAPKIFSVKCSPSNKLRFGSVVLTNAVEDARIKLPVPLLPVFAADKPELIISSERVAP